MLGASPDRSSQDRHEDEEKQQERLPRTCPADAQRHVSSRGDVLRQLHLLSGTAFSSLVIPPVMPPTLSSTSFVMPSSGLNREQSTLGIDETVLCSYGLLRRYDEPSGLREHPTPHECLSCIIKNPLTNNQQPAAQCLSTAQDASCRLGVEGGDSRRGCSASHTMSGSIDPGLDSDRSMPSRIRVGGFGGATPCVINPYFVCLPLSCTGLNGAEQYEYATRMADVYTKQLQLWNSFAVDLSLHLRLRNLAPDITVFEGSYPHLLVPAAPVSSSEEGGSGNLDSICANKGQYSSSGSGTSVFPGGGKTSSNAVHTEDRSLHDAQEDVRQKSIDAGLRSHPSATTESAESNLPPSHKSKLSSPSVDKAGITSSSSVGVAHPERPTKADDTPISRSSSTVSCASAGAPNRPADTNAVESAGALAGGAADVHAAPRENAGQQALRIDVGGEDVHDDQGQRRDLGIYVKLLLLLFLFDARKEVYIFCMISVLMHMNGAFDPVFNLLRSTSHHQPLEATLVQLRRWRDRRNRGSPSARSGSWQRVAGTRRTVRDLRLNVSDGSNGGGDRDSGAASNVISSSCSSYDSSASGGIMDLENKSKNDVNAGPSGNGGIRISRNCNCTVNTGSNSNSTNRCELSDNTTEGISSSGDGNDINVSAELSRVAVFCGPAVAGEDDSNGNNRDPRDVHDGGDEGMTDMGLMHRFTGSQSNMAVCGASVGCNKSSSTGNIATDNGTCSDVKVDTNRSNCGDDRPAEDCTVCSGQEHSNACRVNKHRGCGDNSTDDSRKGNTFFSDNRCNNNSSHSSASSMVQEPIRSLSGRRPNNSDVPSYLERALYQSIVMFFFTCIPWWNPDPSLLVDYEGETDMASQPDERDVYQC